MDLDIITGLPSWYILLCILAGILGSMILYFREKKSEFPAWLKRILGVTRFLIIALIAFLLLSPLLKMTTHQVEKPIIVIVQDNSNSLVLTSDSSFYRDDYPGRLNELSGQLSEDHEVRLYTFGEEVKAVEAASFDTLNYSEQQSDMAAIFDMMEVRYVNRNIGALLIATDGIYNTGFNPVYMSRNISYPIYTLALGDSSERKDAYLKRVLHNRIAYQGNDFPIEIITNARMMNGRVLTLTVSESNKVLESRQITVAGDRFSKTLRMTFPAEEEGTHHYVVELSSETEELTEENNRYDLFIDVLKSKQRILILANSPHPDISALKEAVKSNMNYDIEDMMLSDFSGLPEEYSLVILHQLPSFSPLSPGLLSRLQRADIPLLFILGEQSDLQAFNRMGGGLQLQSYTSGRLNEAQPILNDGFSSFILPADLRDQLTSFPPLNAPFARYVASNSASILFTQRISGIESGDPLWLFQEGQRIRTGVICGTGLWKWRIRSWINTGSHDVFNELINKNIQYLATRDDRRRFRVNARQRTPENADVAFSAELYTESFEPFNEPDVTLDINDEEGNTYNYLFNRTGQSYTLDIGGLGVGSYSYQASTRVGGKVYTDEGGFAVTPVIAERFSLKAEHKMLAELAEENGGQMIYPDEMSAFPSILKERGDVKALLHADRKYIELIDIIWVLVIIIGLLGLEWFLRKWGGSY